MDTTARNAVRANDDGPSDTWDYRRASDSDGRRQTRPNLRELHRMQALDGSVADDRRLDDGLGHVDGRASPNGDSDRIG
jgi:hypothetical protein